MPSVVKPIDFVFVDQSGSSDTRQALQQSRKKIRSQARLHTISKWRTERLQNIDFQLVENPEEEYEAAKAKKAAKTRPNRSPSKGTNQPAPACSSETTTLSQSPKTQRRREPLAELAWDLPLNGYEKARANHNFELNWLSALALNHVGRAPTDDNPAIPSFHRTTIHDWLDLREASFLELVPAIYDFSPLLQDVVEAVLIKVQFVLSGQKHDRIAERKVLNAYGKALESVQDALKDEDLVNSPETLCATQLMQLYELLDFGSPSVWIAHTNGMHQLIRVRGPKRFASRLERSLLCTQVQHIFSQAFMHNQDCFLERAEWQTLLRDMIDDASSVCKAVQVNLWKIIAAVPRILRQASEYILDADTMIDRSLLLDQLRELKRQLVIWRASYLKTTLSDVHLGPALWNSLYSVSLSIGSIVNRLLVALQPISKDAAMLEDETQVFAKKVMELRTGKIVTSGFYIGMIAMATREEWAGVVKGKEECVDRGRWIVRSNVWTRWNAMMGRGGVYGTFWPRSKA